MPNRHLTAAQVTALNAELTLESLPLVVRVEDQIVNQRWVDYYTGINAAIDALIPTWQYADRRFLNMHPDGTNEYIADPIDAGLEDYVVERGQVISATNSPSPPDYALAIHPHALDDLSDVTAPSPGTGQNLQWNGSAWVPATGSGMGNLDICQARRTTDYDFTASFVDVELDTTDEETDSNVIEHSATTDRIIVKQTGSYLIGYSLNNDFENASSVDTKLEGHLRLNDTSVIPGTFSRKGDHYSGSGVIGEDMRLVATAVVSLTANDFISLQLRYTDDAATTLAAQDTTVFVVRLSGAMGATGATGAGANIIVQKDDATVGTVTDTLNFEGTGVSTVVDEGADKTTVTIGGGDLASLVTSAYTGLQAVTVSGSTDDWNPTGLDSATGWKVDVTANSNMTGIVAPSTLLVYLIWNVGTGDFKFKHEDSGSVAANRIHTPASSDFTIAENSSAVIYYDTVSSRWVVFGDRV